MRRDMEAVRAILQKVAEAEDGWDTEAIDSFSEETIAYHVGMMIEAGLLTGGPVSTNAGECFINCRLTWKGNDFLDSAREPKRWSEAKAVIEKVGGASIQVWTDVLSKITMDSLGL